MKPVLGTAFGRTADWKHLRLVCWDCEENEVLVPATIAMEDFHAEQQKFSEAHLACRGGHEEPDYARLEQTGMTLDEAKSAAIAAARGLK